MMKWLIALIVAAAWFAASVYLFVHQVDIYIREMAGK